MPSSLQKLMDAAQGVGIGAADEMSFGLSRRLNSDPEARDKFVAEHPYSVGTGRALSYLIPLPSAGKVKLVAKGAQAAEKAPALLRRLMQLNPQAWLGRAGEQLAAHIPGLAEKEIRDAGGKVVHDLSAKSFAKAGGRGAVSAAFTGTSNNALRKLLAASGQEEERPWSEMPNDALYQGIFGAGGGMLGKGAQALALKTYMHPALANKDKLKASKEQAQKLLDEGTYGTLEGTFQPKAEALQQKIEDVSGQLDPKIKAREAEDVIHNKEWLRQMEAAPTEIEGKVPVEPLENKITELTSPTGKYAQQTRGPEEIARTKTALGGLLTALDPKEGYTSYERLSGAQKNLNERIAGLRKNLRNSIFGDQASQVLTQDVENALHARQTLNQMKEDAVKRWGDKADPAKFQEAVADYRRGADLKSNLLDYERKKFMSGGHGLNHPLRTLIDNTVDSANVRTRLGYGMSGASAERVGQGVGRAVGDKQRTSAKEDTRSVDDLRKHYNQKADEPEEENPYLNLPNTPKKASEKQSENPYLDL